eukprot:753207-Hanusia_phi.AAC.1
MATARTLEARPDAGMADPLRGGVAVGRGGKTDRTRASGKFSLRLDEADRKQRRGRLVAGPGPSA